MRFNLHPLRARDSMSRLSIAQFLQNLLLSILIACPSNIAFLVLPAEAQSTNWGVVNINTTGTGTSSSLVGGQLTLNAAGSGFGGTSDSVSFVQVKTSGNVEMITKVSIPNSNLAPPEAPAGLMIRSSFDSKSIQASVIVTPQNGVNFFSRTSYEGENRLTVGPSLPPPTWVRIVRSGDTVAGYQSANGYTWTLVGTTKLSLTSTFYIGLVGASVADPTLQTFNFSNTVFMRDVPQRSADMALWLRADVGITTNGLTSVTGWQDQSNNVYTAAQPISANRPEMIADSINGLAAVNFNGSSKWLQLPAGYTNFDKGATVFAVIKPPSGSALSDARIFDFANGANNGAFRLYQPTKSGVSFAFYNSGTKTVNATSGITSGFNIAEVVHDGSNAGTISVNGGTAVSNGAMGPIPVVLRQSNFIGKGYTNSAYFEGQMAEILIYNRPLTDAERSRIKSYLFYKYGLGTTPPVSPPEATAAPASAPQEIYSPATGVYASSVNVSLTADPLTEIRYTTNGTNPTPGSTLYAGPIPVITSGTTTIKSIAVEGANQSVVATETIQIDPNSSNVTRAGLNLWLKSDFGVTKDGANNISKWSDVSGNHMDGLVTSNQAPKYLSSDPPNINSAPVVEITNSGTSIKQWFEMPRDFASFPNGASVFIVANPFASSGGGDKFIELGADPSSSAVQLYVKSKNTGTGVSTFSYRVYNGNQTSIDFNGSMNQYQLLEVVQSGSSVSTYKNGTSTGTATGFNLIPNSARLGNFIGNAIASARIAEIIVYNRPLVDAERFGIEAYFHTKYGLGAAPTLAAPIFTPKSDVICDAEKFISLEAPSEASIFYTISNTSTPPPDPTNTPSPTNFLYSAPFKLTQNSIVKARAFKSGYAGNQSSVTTETYKFDSTTCAIRKDSLLTWLRSDVGITVDGSTTNVTSWADISGKNVVALQNTSGNRPVLNPTGINGFPSISFSTNKFLSLPDVYNDFSQGMTAFVVAKKTGSVGGPFFGFSTATTGADTVQFGPTSDTNLRLTVSSGTTATNLNAPQTSDANFHVYETVHNGTTVASILRDGNQLNLSSGMNPISNVSRGWSYVGRGDVGPTPISTTYFNGEVAEIIIYRKELDPDERRAIEEYLLARYGTYITPPTITPASGALPTDYPITMTAKDPGAQIIYSENGGAYVPYVPGNPPKMHNGLVSITAKSVLTWGQSSPTTAVFQLDDNTANLPRSEMILWLKGDFGVTFDASNRVSNWKDISGSNYHATQGTTANQPTYSATAVNGKPSINFSGTQWMQLASGFSNFADGATVFLVTKPPSSVSADARFFDLSSQTTSSLSNNLILSQPTSGSSQFYVYDSNGNVSSVLAESSVTQNQFQLLEANHTGRQAATLLTNGDKVSTGAIKNPANVQRTANFLGKAWGSANYFQGSISELIIYNRSLLPEERRAVEAYLIGRYALTNKPVKPTILPYDGVYSGLLGKSASIGPVSMFAFPNAPTLDIEIHYTTDGTTPTALSSKYEGPIFVSKSTVINAIATKQGSPSSDVATRYINISPQADSVSRDGLQLWYKSDFGVITDGNTVNNWIDLSTTGREINAFQSEVNKQPIYSSDYSFPRITTGVDPRYFEVESGLSDFSKGLTFYAVTRPLSTATGTDSWIFAASNGSTTNNVEVRDDASAERARLRIQANGNSVVGTGDSLVANKFQILEGVQNGSGNLGTLSVDGTQVGSGTLTPAVNVTRMLNRLGANPTSSAENYIGDYVELLVYNRSLTDSERLAVQNYLKVKYQTPYIQGTAQPVLQPVGATYSGPLDVALTGPTDAVIFYTTDGTTPTTSSKIYSKPIRITYTTTVKAISVLNGITSAVSSQVYTLNADMFRPPTGNPTQMQLQIPTTAIPLI